MKSILAATLVIILMVIIITPVFAIGQDYAGSNAGPVILQGNDGGSPPRVLGIWEQDLSGVLENGDSVHSVEGTQFLPPCNEGEGKTVQLYAIVTDTGNRADLKAVNAEVQMSGGTYHESITLTQTSLSEGIWSAENGDTAHIIRYDDGVSQEDVMTKLKAGTASVWKGEVTFPSTQNAGIFTVTVVAIDTDEHYSASLKNSFTYLPLACIEYDFSTINYGDLGLGPEKWVYGDEIFGTGDKPTVRNTGNVPARIRIIQNDMGFGQDLQNGWNVRYKARIGKADSTPQYSPNDNVLISGVVNQGKIQSMDFSIQVIKGTGSHIGSMTLGYDSLPSVQLEDDELSRLPVPEFPGFKEFLDTVMQHINLD